MTAIFQAVSEWAVQTALPAIVLWSVFGTVVTVAAAIVGDRRARLKSDVLVATILLLPLMIFTPKGVLNVPVTAPAAVVTEFTSQATPGTRTHSVDRPALSPRETMAPAATAHPFGLTNLLLLIWAGGALVGLVRLSVASRALAGLVKRSEVTGRTHNGIPILRSRETTVPFATGFLRPAIVLPAVVPCEDLVLRHESAHVEALDTWALRITLLTRAVFWPHPLLWIMARMAATSREIACDSASVRSGDAVAYARMLRAFAAAGHTPSPSMAGTPDLRRRIRALGSDQTTAMRRNVRVPLALTLLGIAIAGCDVERQAGIPVAQASLSSEPISVLFRGDADRRHVEEALWFAGIRPYDADWGGLRPVRVEVTRDLPLTAQETRALHDNPRVTEVSLARGSDTVCLNRRRSADELMVVVMFDFGTSAEDARRAVETAVRGDICDLRKVANWVRIPDVAPEKRQEVVDKLLADPSVVSVDGTSSRPESDLTPTDWKTIETSTVRLEVPGTWDVFQHAVGERGFSLLRVQAPSSNLSIQIDTHIAGTFSAGQEKRWGEQEFLDRIAYAREITSITDILKDPEAKSEGSVVVQAAGGTYYASYATQGDLRYLVLAGGEMEHHFRDLLRMIESIRFTDGEITRYLEDDDRAEFTRLMKPIEDSLTGFYALVGDSDENAPDAVSLSAARRLAAAGCRSLEEALDHPLSEFMPRAQGRNEGPALGEMALMGHLACRFSTDYADAFANRVSDRERYLDVKYQLAVWDQTVKGFRKTWLDG
ncbi:MAG: hypothetical protein JJ896_10105 [Rhodothermales bacterium]|nr:hypothetical protein [Rhodothermales bacterium]MBO6779992.1 hypothetical protein [Rhodothermales bacterium]